MRYVIILLILILLTPLVFGVTQDNHQDVIRQTEYVCKQYNKVCKVHIVTDSNPYALTDKNNVIKVSTGLINELNISQLRGVLFHEVGHVVLNHVQVKVEYLNHCKDNCDMNYLSRLSHQQEYQADRFSVLLTKYSKVDGDLSGALIIMTPLEDLFTVHPSHPSTADRIQRIGVLLNEQTK